MLAVTRKICEHFKIDHLRLISSGCMLIISPAENKENLIAAITAAQIPVSEIGKIKEKERILISNQHRINILPPDSDELYKILS